MLSFYRTLEVLLFAAANFLPYIILSVYVFYKNQRYSNTITYIVCAMIFLIQFFTRYWSAVHSVNTNIWLSAFRLMIFMTCYLYLFDLHWGKVLFIELIFANLGNFLIIAAVALEHNVFNLIVHHTYCWHTSLLILVFHLIFTLPLYHALRKWGRPFLETPPVAKEWSYYWIVPAIFYLIWQYQVNGGKQSSLSNMRNIENTIFLFIINIGALLIYYLIIRLNGEIFKNLNLERQKYQTDIENLEYQMLHERFEETRRMRHDLKHHAHTILYYLEEQQYDNAKNYVLQVNKELPSEKGIHFCSNRTINNLMLYFAYQAQTESIDFQAQLSIPETISIAEHDISVLLGNLLTNALEACKEQTSSDRKIIIKGEGKKNTLVFTIDNTCENNVIVNRKGDFVTTKKYGNGIGLRSCNKIVKKYDGVFSAEKKENMFYVSFLLNM